MLTTRSGRIVLLLAVLVAPVVAARAPAGADAQKYLLPPKAIVDAFDVEPLPGSTLSPNKQVLALTYRHGQPGIAELAQPVLRLAGARVNPKTYGPHRTSLIYAITHEADRRRQRDQGRRRRRPICRTSSSRRTARISRSSTPKRTGSICGSPTRRRAARRRSPARITSTRRPAIRATG